MGRLALPVSKDSSGEISVEGSDTFDVFKRQGASVRGCVHSPNQVRQSHFGRSNFDEQASHSVLRGCARCH